MPTKSPTPGRKKLRGKTARFDVQHLCELLTWFAYEFDKDGKNAEEVISQAFKDWEMRGGTPLGYHTKRSVARGGVVTEYTRRAVCRLVKDFASTEPAGSELHVRVKAITPGGFVRRDDSEALHAQVDGHLKSLTRGLARGYYMVPGNGWEIYESLTHSRRLLHDLAGHIDQGSSDQQRLCVGKLAYVWLETAHLAGTESPANMRAVHTIGKRALGRGDERSETATLLGLLGHSSPVDASARQAVSGVTWHRPLDVFEDWRIELSLLKHNRARADYLYGVQGREDSFSVRQIILGARLKLCSDRDSRTNDAQDDMARAKELLSGTNDRTRAYFHLASHYFHSRRVAGGSARSGVRQKQLDDIRLARHHYAAEFGSEPNLYTAACDVRLAELSPSSVTRAELIEAVTTILATPFDRCCVADLSGVFDGRSRIYSTITYDRQSFGQRAARQRRVRCSS